MKNGVIKRIIGPVVDVEFVGTVPEIYSALTVMNGAKKLVLETEQHIGGNTVRAVAMDSTDGLSRGQEVTDTGAPISVPVGKETLGRIFNVLGEAIDDLPAVAASAKEGGKPNRSPIHRKAPSFVS